VARLLKAKPVSTTMTLERPMFPPVDPTRRRLLTVAAGGAFAATIAAAVPTIAPATATPVDPSTAPHPDAKLLELGLEYERLWAIETSLEEEPERLWIEADRVRYEKLGVDPDDKEACRAVLDNRHSEWNAVREIADEEVGYSHAWRKWNLASLKTERVGRKILKIAPNTMAGLLVRVRVVETQEEEIEAVKQLLAEIRGFAKDVAVNGGVA
jgi:hypothetical protein